MAAVSNAFFGPTLPACLAPTTFMETRKARMAGRIRGEYCFARETGQNG